MPSNVTFPDGFLLSANERYWSNETETLKYLSGVIAPYLADKKDELGLPPTQRSCVIWDAFSEKATDAVKEKLSTLRSEEVQVPKNMTHLLQPLDLNGVAKKMEKKEFSEYFTSVITQAMLKNPNIDVTTIEVDLKLSTLKQLHAATLIKIYNFFKTDEGKKTMSSGWRAAGITEALKKARQSNTVPSLNPYA